MALKSWEVRSSHLLPALDDNTLNLPTDPCGTSVYKAPGSDGPLLGIGLVKTPIINHITEAKPPPPDEDASALLPFVSSQLKAQEAELCSVPSTPELFFLPSPWRWPTYPPLGLFLSSNTNHCYKNSFSPFQKIQFHISGNCLFTTYTSTVSHVEVLVWLGIFLSLQYECCLHLSLYCLVEGILGVTG